MTVMMALMIDQYDCHAVVAGGLDEQSWGLLAEPPAELPACAAAWWSPPSTKR